MVDNNLQMPPPDRVGQARPTILFVSPVADLKGGGEKVLLELMANPAIRPAVAIPSEGEIADYARQRQIPVSLFDLGAVAAVHRPPRPSDLLAAATGAARCAQQLARISRDVGAAALHTNGLKVHVIGSAVRLLHRVPVLAHVHDIPHTRLEKAIWKGVARSVTRMMVVSSPCFPASPLPTRVAVVSNGVRAADTLPPIRAVPADPTIGFVGRFHPFKGVDLLLDWFEHASIARPSLRLLIRGRADDEGAAYWDGLQGRIRPLVDAGRCRVLGWSAPGEDPYAGIDVLAVPSRTPDPAPLVVLEALSRGIPVIGYPAGGVPGLIGGPEHGALAADGAAFEAALNRLLEPETYSAAGRAGARRVRELFTIERFWAAINAQYAQAGVGMGVPG